VQRELRAHPQSWLRRLRHEPEENRRAPLREQQNSPPLIAMTTDARARCLRATPISLLPEAMIDSGILLWDMPSACAAARKSARSSALM
jgi:hypothetical protein